VAIVSVARNIEIKARLDDLRETLAFICEIAGVPTELWQEDTFFRCDIGNGRLKLRHETGDTNASELIFYVREDDSPDPKASNYLRCPVSSFDQLRDVLGAAMGIVGRVVKHRYVFRIGNARIHVDEVVGLSGGFLEIEVVLGEADSVESGYTTMSTLMAQLNIDSSQLVANAYVDMLVVEKPDDR
jgi:predicted adenylyl cyclase CyaB